MKCQIVFGGNFFFADIDRSVARPCVMQTRGNAGCETVGVSALGKRAQTYSSSIRLGNEQMKWADTPKIRAGSAVVQMRGDF